MSYAGGGGQRLAVVHPDGELDIATVDDLDRLLRTASDDQDLLVDLERVTFVDSVTLSLFVRTAQRHRAAGTVLVLAAPSPIVRRVLTTTHLDEVLTCTDSVAEAQQLLGRRDLEE